MDFFRKTLEFVESRINKGYYQEAIEILNNHINTEHKIQSDLYLLKKAIDEYNKLVIDARNSLEKISSENKLHQEIVALKHIDEAKTKLDKIKEIMKSIKNDKIKLD